MVIDFWNVLNVSLFPKRNKVKDVVLEIAHIELVLICPRCIVDSWSTPLSALHREVSSPDCPLEMFARGKPTNEKIIKGLFIFILAVYLFKLNEIIIKGSFRVFF